MKKHKYKIFLSIALILISYGYIIYIINDFIKYNKHYLSSIQINKEQYVLLVFVLLLMPINWLLESIKWRELIKEIQQINYLQSFKAVFSGITIGIFTPNRIGEIGGRILFLEKGKRTYGTISTWLGSFSQFIITIIIGIIGSITFLTFSPANKAIDIILNKTSIIILSIFLSFIIWFYFNSSKAHKLLIKLPFFRSKAGQLNYLSKTSSIKLLVILVLSLLRYIVFSSQFYLLLHFFNVNITILQAFVSISIVYLITTLIPTTTLAELGIRGSVAIFIIGLYSSNNLGIIFTSFSLWFINLAVPAVIGAFFLLKKKV